MSKSEEDPSLRQVRQLVPKCLACGLDLGAHSFAQLATTVIDDDNKDRVRALYEHFQKREWACLQPFREFKGNRDTVVVIKGPHSGGMVMLFRDPAELFARTEIYPEQLVNDEELAAISRILPEGSWKQL
ncbi:MAG: hypothetical protein JWQ87_5283 [Candidatus Sulfotelmatobacter sp.]|nr:hypothetical protein [Candidatus Sulfotelmatobacter sp.]